MRRKVASLWKAPQKAAYTFLAQCVYCATNQQNNMKTNLKIILYVVAGLVVLGIIGNLVGGGESEKKDTAEVKTEAEKPKEPELTPEQILKNNLKSLAGFKGVNDQSTEDEVKFEAIMFSAYAKTINQYENDSSKPVRALALELKKKVSAIQKQEFPKLREAVGTFLAAKLWENNVTCSVTGGKYKTLDLTAGMFANNANIKKFGESAESVVSLYRFKQVNYRWYKDQDDYQYFTYKTPGDGEIVVVEE
jgi:hypothetical protein